jgi:hypothetical protein
MQGHARQAALHLTPDNCLRVDYLCTVAWRPLAIDVTKNVPALTFTADSAYQLQLFISAEALDKLFTAGHQSSQTFCN